MHKLALIGLVGLLLMATAVTFAQSSGGSANSQRLGEFDFALVPGS